MNDKLAYPLNGSGQLMSPSWQTHVIDLSNIWHQSGKPIEPIRHTHGTEPATTWHLFGKQTRPRVWPTFETFHARSNDIPEPDLAQIHFAVWVSS